MKIVIYSNSSLGGCYEYAKQIAEEFSRNNQVEKCIALFPKDSGKECPQTNDILMKDRFFKGFTKIFGKLYFIIRSWVNPIRAYKYASKNKVNLFIFNDFDQVTSFFWTRRFYKRKFKTAIILHDPDRTAYFSNKSLSEKTMQKIMNIIDIAFYHEKLPLLPYYQNIDNKIIFKQIPHGIYAPQPPDKIIANQIEEINNKGYTTISITGNVRAEKNYTIVMDTIAKLPKTVLIIAGKTVTANENIETYKNYAQQKGISNRVLFINKYLNNSEMSAIFKYSTIILLYYSPTFKSQSGILNSLSPFSPKLIVSDIESGMTHCVRQYNIGKIVAPNNAEALAEAIENFPENNPYKDNWQKFADYSSWKNNIEIQIAAYRQSLKNNE